MKKTQRQLKLSVIQPPIVGPSVGALMFGLINDGRILMGLEFSQQLSARGAIIIVAVMVAYVGIVYGPIGAFLAEFFPGRIRYTSVSVPYHIGNGVFGGLLPLIGLSLVAATGNIYAGLYYPMIVAGITFIVGSLLLKETGAVKVWNEASGEPMSAD